MCFERYLFSHLLLILIIDPDFFFFFKFCDFKRKVVCINDTNLLDSLIDAH